jgi:hypothetical protein
MNTKYLLIRLLCLLPTATLTGQTLSERLYLPTDKTLYLAGETVWLKAIATDAAGRPSDLSKVAYVELLDDASAQIQIKLALEKGAGEGAFTLPVGLPTGHYLLTAYTRYMQNDGESVYFRQLLPVINTFIEGVRTATDAPTQQPEAAPSNTFALRADRAVYPVRTAGTISLDSLPDDLHTLSVSIAGHDCLAMPANHIVGWRKNQAATAPQRRPDNVPYILPEYEGPVITGKLVDPTSGEPPPDNLKPIVLLGATGDGIRLFNGEVDGDANVVFYTRRITGIREMATAVLSSSDQAYRVDIRSPFVQHTFSPLPLAVRPQWNDCLLQRSVALQIRQTYTGDSLLLPGQPEQSLFRRTPAWRYLLDEYTRFTTMAEVITEFVIGLRFRQANGVRSLTALSEDHTGFASEPALALLDGIPITDHEAIYRYNPLLVKEIEVYQGRFVFGGAVFEGIASFKTYNLDYPGLEIAPSMQLFDYEGPQVSRRFYAPAYTDEKQRASRLPDYRHTLLWAPRVAISGRSARVDFTTSDLKGDFVVTAEGLTREGVPVYASLRIRVE